MEYISEAALKMGNGSSSSAPSPKRRSDNNSEADYGDELPSSLLRDRDSYYDRESGSPGSLRARRDSYEDNKSLRRSSINQ